MPAYTVNSTSADFSGSGTSGTLPYVVSQANLCNTNADGSEIELIQPSHAATITLNATLELSETAGPEVIDGPGAGLLTISGGGKVSVFNVGSIADSSDSEYLRPDDQRGLDERLRRRRDELRHGDAHRLHDQRQLRHQEGGGLGNRQSLTSLLLHNQR